MIGILEGLKKIGLIGEEDGVFWAKWVEAISKEGRRRKRQEGYEYDDDSLVGEIREGNKKVKVDISSKDTNKPKNHNKPTIPLDKIRMITKRQHLN